MPQIIALIIFLIIPFIVVWVTKLLETVSLWQSKNYNQKRVVAHLGFEGKLTLDDEFTLIIRIGLLAICLMYLLSPLSSILGIAILIAYAYYDLQALKDLRKLMFKRLHNTSFKQTRSTIIFILSIVVAFLPITYLMGLLLNLNVLPVFEKIAQVNEATLAGEVWLNFRLAVSTDGVTVMSLPLFIALFCVISSILIDLLLPIIVWFWVIATSPVNGFYKRFVTSRAATKLGKLSDLKIIYICGGRSLSSSLSILTQYYSKHYSTVALEYRHGEAIALATEINTQVTKKTKVLIIAQAGLDLIDDSSQELFFLPDILIMNEFVELDDNPLVDAHTIVANGIALTRKLKPDGLVILNGANEYCSRIASRVINRKILYYPEIFAKPESIGSETKGPQDENVYIYDKLKSGKKTAFLISYKGELHRIKANFDDKSLVDDLSIAIITCVEIGTGIDIAISTSEEIEFVLPTQDRYAGLNGSIIIDDTVNMAIERFVSVIPNIAKDRISGRKWIITQGFFELGERKLEVYKPIVAKLVKYMDALITTDYDLYLAVKDLDTKFLAVYVEDIFSLEIAFRRDVQSGDLIWLVGQLPSKVMNAIKSK
jgi:hypothetical protein